MSLRLQTPAQPVLPATAGRSARLTLLSIDERPAVVDPILANIFKSMRAATGLSVEALAQVLATSPSTIHGLEAGHIRLFSSREDAFRLIDAYGRFVEVDVRPVLDRLMPQIVDDVTPLHRVASPASAAPLPPHQLPASPRSSAHHIAAPAPQFQKAPKRRQSSGKPTQPGPLAATKRRKPSRPIRWLKRISYVVGTVLALAAGTVMVAESHPRAARAAAEQLPSGLSQSLRGAVDRISAILWRRGDGLRWIEVSNPQSRKADRLPTSH